jgi:hypothetical protein
MVSPDPEPLWMQAAPWSPSTNGPVSGEAVYVDVQDVKDLDKYNGKLGGKIVLFGAMRPTPVTAISYRNTGGTDHLSFDAVGLPGFQYIQDPPYGL